MKKIVALMLSLCLLMMSGAVLAETAVTEVNWADFEAKAAEIPGQFVQLNQVALAFYLPEALQNVELTEEEVNDQHYLAYFTNAEKGWNVAVQYVNTDGKTLDELAEILKADSDVALLQPMVVNGISCLNYDIVSTSSTVITYVTEAGYGLEFVFAPTTDEEFGKIITVMGASIQPYAE